MIRSLQKRHRMWWLCFSIVLPLLFFFSLGGILDASNKTDFDFSKYDAVHQNKLGINLSPSPIGNILRVEVLKPLAQPSPVMFYGEQFLGKLGPVGAYVFHLQADTLQSAERQLWLKDGIKAEINEPINLQK